MRRVRVAVRPKVRSQRARRRASVLTVAVLGVLAFATARQLGREISLGALRERLLPPATTVVGAPEPLRPRIEALLRESSGERAQVVAQRMLEFFPCLASARLQRDWLSREARFEVAARPAIAVVEQDDRSAGYLSDDGVVFAAPSGVYDVSSPVVAARAASPDELKRLAAFLPLAERADELPAPLARMTYLSAQDGWEALLGDGTKLLWGSLTFAPQKFARLREVLLDARARDGEQKVKAMEADLRFFEDGKILLRPLRS